MQRHLRLRHRADFKRLRTLGRVWRHPLFILSVAPNDLPHNRYGFVTSKGLGNAVMRNRTRRVLREVIRQSHPHLKSGYDMVLIARNPVVGKPYMTIRQAIETTLRKADLWDTSPGTQDT